MCKSETPAIALLGLQIGPEPRVVIPQGKVGNGHEQVGCSGGRSMTLLMPRITDCKDHGYLGC